MVRPSRGSAVYVLPNLITAGNLFWGFFAIIKALNGQFGWAAYAIFLAGIFDMLDGRVAKLTKSTSEFGVQFDSLCDAVSFGVAPAFIMFQYSLNNFGRIGWIICFVFMASGVLRLARFNVLSSIGKTAGDFAGLPIPVAAIAVASFIALLVDVDYMAPLDADSWQALVQPYLSAKTRAVTLATMASGLSLLMVSTILYRSHKQIRIKSIKPFQLLVILIGVLALLAYQPELLGFSLVFAYVLTGPMEWILGWKQPVDEHDIFENHPDFETHLDDHPEKPLDRNNNRDDR